MESYFNEYSKNEEMEKNIKPYLEALSIFTKIKRISENFSNIYERNNKRNLSYNFDSLEDFIKYFKQNILIQKGDDLQRIKEKNYLQKSPEKIFYFFLDELHKLFKMNIDEEEEKENNKIKPIEYDREKARQSFNKFYKKDRSVISDLFFGRKLIIKTCKNCNMTEYNYKYLRAIPLNLINIVSEEIELEQIFRGLEKSFEKEDLCQICSNKQKFKAQIKIDKKPEILIFVITNSQKVKKVKFQDCIYENSYKLISVVIDSQSSILGDKKYKILYDYSTGILSDYKKKNIIEKGNIPEGIPYVLFYKRIKEDSDEEDYDDFTNGPLIP
jgi:ubiquitin C-terminal hydrolase